MFLKVVLLLFIQNKVGSDLVLPRSERPPAMFPNNCNAGEKVINDCNWCRCFHGRYICDNRDCRTVDRFGHFNDAIEEIASGLEGHGSWRSTRTVCEPGVHYQRGDLLCVCTEAGEWPSAVCRDQLRALYQVEPTEHTRPSELHSCTAGQLFLYGCNVCVCEPDGRIRPAACTQRDCTPTDPVLHEHDQPGTPREPSEVYAECEENSKCTIGCQECICLKNHRLLCGKCDQQVGEVTEVKEDRGYCSGAGSRQFNIECNICKCDERGRMYCTVLRCLKESLKPAVELSRAIDLAYREVDAPLDPLLCQPGTKFYSDCNACYCSETADGKKVLSCSRTLCNPLQNYQLTAILSNCVENTVYLKRCMLCRCDIVDGDKRESCVLTSECANFRTASQRKDLNSLSYCEPWLEYRRDCNTCRCLPSGDVVECSSGRCGSPAWGAAAAGATGAVGAGAGAVTVEVVPVEKRGPFCQSYRVYRIHCNICVCLFNGNMICSTADCTQNNK